MSILGKIIGGIFNKKDKEPEGAPVVTAPPTPAAPIEPHQPAPAVPVAGTPAHEREGADVAGILDLMNDQRDQKLNWRTSIVDLMKLLDLDSSLGERKELAKELGYTGDMNDSATMNIWLHKNVLGHIAANGGNVPKELLD